LRFFRGEEEETKKKKKKKNNERAKRVFRLVNGKIRS